MEQTIEDPPTSAVLLDHCHFSQVIFNSVEKFYVPGGDITCYYTLTQHFIPRRKDWIGIFRVSGNLGPGLLKWNRQGQRLQVGWKTTREYYTFMWITLPKNTRSKMLKTDDEYYQFCYVDQDGVVRGASIPFQFRPENEEDLLVVTTQGEVEEIEQQNKELCKENQELKDSCVSLQKQNSDMQAELQRKQEELETLQSINKKLEQKVQEQKDYWETELLHLKEQNQKVSSENEKMGITVDQLQAQLSTQEKEMEKLVQGAQDKTEQLEHLKKENGQLFLSLTEQREHQKKLEQTVEEMKHKESAAAKKQQELTASFPLSPCNLSPHAYPRDFLKKENHRLLNYMGLDYDSLPYQVPTSDQEGAEQNPGLLSIKKCPICESDFADGFCDHILEQQWIQTLCLKCPICNKVFPEREKQIFEDHVFCHSL
uniref:Calcium-binding and coiled-coil domain-containing protein 2 n=1 Tax=Microcebus murinus TaxID=30608 RepID=A0A8C5XIM2_MICMU